MRYRKERAIYDTSLWMYLQLTKEIRRRVDLLVPPITAGTALAWKTAGDGILEDAVSRVSHNLQRTEFYAPMMPAGCMYPALFDNSGGRICCRHSRRPAAGLERNIPVHLTPIDHFLRLVVGDELVLQYGVLEFVEILHIIGR